MAITIQSIYWGLCVLIGGLALFFFGWYQNPYNKASILRSVTKKPHAVIGLVYPAGQIKHFVRKWAQPSFQIEGKVFTPIQKFVKYVASVPTCFFSTEDCLQLNIDSSEHNDIKRSPEQIEAAYMITKGLYEQKAQKRINRLELMLMAVLIVSAGLALGLFIIHSQITQLGYQVSAVSTTVNSSINALPNLIR